MAKIIESGFSALTQELQVVIIYRGDHAFIREGKNSRVIQPIFLLPNRSFFQIEYQTTQSATAMHVYIFMQHATGAIGRPGRRQLMSQTGNTLLEEDVQNVLISSAMSSHNTQGSLTVARFELVGYV